MTPKFFLIGFFGAVLIFVTQDMNEMIETPDEIELPLPNEDDTSNLCFNYSNSTTTICSRPSLTSKIPS
jgi:hypothetical protein